MSKLRFSTAKKLCGLDEHFEIKTESDYEFALGVWREQTVAARRTGNDERAAVLSQCKELFKRRYNRVVSPKCPDCGQHKSLYAVRCNMCARIERFYRHNIPAQSTMKNHEIEDGLVLVPAITHRTGELTAVCRKLATTGQIGDCFTSPKSPTSISAVCRTLGLSVIVRATNLDEKDKKKRIYRVWRCDGLDMEAVNEIIRKRLRGEPVPTAKRCVPPPASSLPNRHPERGGRPGRPARREPIAAAA